MATREQWQKIRDEVAQAPSLSDKCYRRDEAFCVIGWLCRDVLKDVPNDNPLGTALHLSDGDGGCSVRGIYANPGDSPGRRAVRDRLRGLGLTVTEADALQIVNDQPWEESRQAVVLAWLDRQIEEARA